MKALTGSLNRDERDDDDDTRVAQGARRLTIATDNALAIQAFCDTIDRSRGVESVTLVGDAATAWCASPLMFYRIFNARATHELRCLNVDSWGLSEADLHAVYSLVRSTDPLTTLLDCSETHDWPQYADEDLAFWMADLTQWNFANHRITAMSLNLRPPPSQRGEHFEAADDAVEAECLMLPPSLRLLKLIGQPVEHLFLKNDGLEPLYLTTSFFALLLEATPRLKRLGVWRPIMATMRTLVDAYEDGLQVECLWLHAPTVLATSSVKVFALALCDARSPLSQTLRELKISFDDEHHVESLVFVHVLERVLEENRSLRFLLLKVPAVVQQICQALLSRFNGQMLPYTRFPLPVRSRAAFISAVFHGADDPDHSDAASSDSDANSQLWYPLIPMMTATTSVYSLIFEFAGEAELRVIKVS
ncbi:hypothetical protein PINS_up010364 [Pythium insidiosum]|nr:hypothetical protein PINS_up010364 [Pythium insidiosum]